jgi:DNA-binding winged helix-turn-helix (wHTH) protein
MRAFGHFRLDTVSHCLLRHDERARLTPKAFDVLRYLVEHADRLVTPDELLEALWPETYVNPEGIRKYILEIRKALGDQRGKPLFIETFPKRGYKFVAKVTGETPVSPSGVAAELAGNMVGRDAALARLNSHFANALGARRQLTFVTGEAGIGKTTLVDSFHQLHSGHCNLRIARGQCIEGFGGKEAYYPMLEALGALIRDSKDDSLVQTLAKHAPTWLAQFPSLVRDEQRASLQREILGSTRERMVREICELLEALTARTPAIVILEDLHWADASTLDLISAVARRREPAKLLLIGTYRPVDVVLSQSPLKTLKQDLLVRHLCNEVAIEHLEEPNVAEYLARIFSVETVPAGLTNLLHQNSGGNPLFLVAIVQDMANKGLIAADSGRLTLTAPLQEVYPGIPETLQQMLEIQLEQLSPDEQAILQSGAVAGPRFSAWVGAAMLDTAPAAIEQQCERLANRQQFIRSIGIHEAPNGAPSAHYEFRHSIYRQALYRRLSNLYRSKLHRSLGECLLPLCLAGRRELASELARHFEEGRDYEQATRCLMLTAANSTNRCSHRDSIQTLRHALELVPTLSAGIRAELEVQILQRIGDLHYALGEMSDSATSYEIAAERAAGAGLKTAQLDALLHLSCPARYLDAARGYEVLRQAVQLSRTLDDPLLAAQTELAAASFRLLYHSWSREDAQACAHANEAIRQLSGSLVPPPDVFYIYVRTFQGEFEKALQEAESLIDGTSNPTAYVLAQAAKTLALMSYGRYGEVLQIVRTERDLAERNGEDPWIFILCDVWLRANCFDYEGVRQLSSIIMRSDAEQHATRSATIAMLSCGFGEILEGRYDEALHSFTYVRDLRRTPRFLIHWYWRIQAELGTAEAHLAAGRVAMARGDADRFLESAVRGADPNMHALAWEIKSRIARAERDSAAAGDFIGNALAILDRFDVPAVAWRVHASASDLFAAKAEYQKAEDHRKRAAELIMRIADSFDAAEPLRQSLLDATPVRRIFGQSTSA